MSGRKHVCVCIQSDEDLISPEEIAATFPKQVSIDLGEEKEFNHQNNIKLVSSTFQIQLLICGMLVVIFLLWPLKTGLVDICGIGFGALLLVLLIFNLGVMNSKLKSSLLFFKATDKSHTISKNNTVCSWACDGKNLYYAGYDQKLIKIGIPN